MGFFGDCEISSSQIFGRRHFLAEGFETGVGGSAWPSAIRGYHNSSSIFLGSGDFGPFLGSPLRRLLELPAIMRSGRQVILADL